MSAHLTRRRMMIATLSGLGAALIVAACDDDGEGGAAPTPDAGAGGAGGADMATSGPDAEIPDAELPPEVTIPESWYALRPTLAAWFDGAPEAAIMAVALSWLRPFADEQATVEDLTPLAEGALAQADEASALASFEAGILADFEGLAPVSVEGWQLSATEARLCALSVLLAEEA